MRCSAPGVAKRLLLLTSAVTLAGGGSKFSRFSVGQRFVSGDGAAVTCAAAIPLMRLRGGSWLFNPKIVPVTDGQGGVIQWRQQPTKLCSAKGVGEGLEDDLSKARSSEGLARGIGGAEPEGELVHQIRAKAEGVQRTNDESTASKASAASEGYFQDDFIQSFVDKVPARTALINRGYFARVQAMRSMVSAFLDTCIALNRKCQILSLGAGFDTTYWAMKRLQKLDNCVWVEVDFADTVARKRAVVEAEPLLAVLASVEDLGKHGKAETNFYTDFRLSQLARLYEERPEFVQRDLGLGSEEIHTGDLHCIGGDLADARQLAARLFGNGTGEGVSVDDSSAVGGSRWSGAPGRGRGLLKRDVPTLVLTECVLQYLDEEAVNSLLHQMHAHLGASLFLSYDQIGPDDPFGQVMTASLRHRGSPLKSIEAAPGLQAMRQRFVTAGYRHVASASMLDVYYKMLPRNLTAAAEGLESFDEHEEWAVSCQHYSLTLATASCDDPLLDALFNSTPFSSLMDLASTAAASAGASVSALEEHRPSVAGGLDVEAGAASQPSLPAGLFGHSSASV